MNRVISEKTENSAIDITKFIMAILVVGIHTEPFEFNIWLDRGFGMVTRLCVPFFFVTSAYFFFRSQKPIKDYIIRIFTLYAVWSIVYLPFDVPELSQMSVTDIFKRYFWMGNEHALWYLCGTIIATIIVYLLHKCLSDKFIVLITTVLLFIGCIGSTWAPVVGKITLGISDLTNIIGFRNGLFYGSPYVAIGLLVAADNSNENNKVKYIKGFIVSMCLLAVESIVFVYVFHTKDTILWMSVLPASYYLFRIILCSEIELKRDTAIVARKLSTLIYVSHNLFVILFKGTLSGIALFICTVAISISFGIVVIFASDKIKILKKLY